MTTNDQNSDHSGVLTFDSSIEVSSRAGLVSLMNETPVVEDQIPANLGLFLDGKNLSRILLMDHLYKQIVDTQGVVMDFGTRWGHNMTLFQTLRSIYEPFNRHRLVIGFDTFEGFPSVAPEDGDSGLMFPGNLGVGPGYAEYLKKLLDTHESMNPLAHIKKNEVVKGDAVQTLSDYLSRNPQTIVSLAYFDFDIYEPTKKCLELIRPRLTKGSVVAFDELNDKDSPGETVALMEVFGLQNIRLQRFRYASRVSYFVVE
jgi:hypothetical protein